jgi:hypothetical protein
MAASLGRMSVHEVIIVDQADGAPARETMRTRFITAPYCWSY